MKYYKNTTVINGKQSLLASTTGRQKHRLIGLKVTMNEVN
jgi:hypothetical protein